MSWIGALLDAESTLHIDTVFEKKIIYEWDIIHTTILQNGIISPNYKKLIGSKFQTSLMLEIRRLVALPIGLSCKRQHDR